MKRTLTILAIMFAISAQAQSIGPTSLNTKTVAYNQHGGKVAKNDTSLFLKLLVIEVSILRSENSALKKRLVKLENIVLPSFINPDNNSMLYGKLTAVLPTFDSLTTKHKP